MMLNEISEYGTLSVMQMNSNDFESYKTVLEKSISPARFAEINNQIDPNTMYAIGFMILGFLTIFILEKSASTKSD